MRRTIAALLVLLALPAAADAQMAPAPSQAPLEITKRESPPESKLGRLVVPPAPQSEDAVRDAERGVADLERVDRDRRALREQAPPLPRRPDLGYDVQSGFRQRSASPSALTARRHASASRAWRAKTRGSPSSSSIRSASSRPKRSSVAGV